MSTPGDRDDLDQLLAGSSPVSRQYRGLADEVPSAALDEAVLAKSRAPVSPDVASVPAPRSPPSFRRWTVPGALAASVVLSMIVLRQGSDRTGFQSTLSVPAQEEAGETAAEGVASGVADAQRALATAPPPATIAPAAERAPPVADAGPRNVAPAVPRAQSGPPVPASAVALPPPSAAIAVVTRPPPADERDETARGGSVEEPDVWLMRIRGLRRAGNNAAADAELDRFRDAYPEYFRSNPDISVP